MQKQLNVLILEDNPSDAELLLFEIRRAGYEPSWQIVDNQKDFLAHLDAGLDIILSDYSMPQFTGLEALHLLKKSGYDIPLILISGTIGEEIAVECMRQGADDYLMKDRLERLGTAIENALDKKVLRDEKQQAQQEMQMMLSLSRQASTETNLNDLLFFIANQIVEIIPPAETSSIFIYFKEEEVVRVQAWAGFEDDEIKGLEFKAKSNEINRVFFEKKPTIINDATDSPDFEALDGPNISKIKSQMAVPIIYKEHVIGLVFADNLSRIDAFSQKDLDLLETIGYQLAGLIENVRLLENVRKSIEYQKAIFETTSVATAIIGEDTTVLMVNGEFEKLSGYSKDELESKKKWTDFVVAEDLNKMIEYHQKRRKDPASVEKVYEFRAITKAGEIKNILLNVDLIPGTKQSVISLLDISDRIKAQQDLLESEQKFKWLYINAPIAYHILSKDGIIMDVNQKWCEVLKYSKEEVIGRPIFDFIYEEERQTAEKSFQNKKNSRQKYFESGKRNYCTKSGEIRTFKTYDFFSLDEKEQVSSVQTTIQDITDSETANKKLQQSEDKYHSVVDDSPGLIDRFLPDGTIVFANEAYCKFFGKTQDELIGTKIQSTIPEEDRESVMATIAALNKESPMQTSENKVTRHDGEIRNVRWIDRALFDVKGKITSYQSFGEDITEQKIAEQALKAEQEKAQKYLDIADVIIVALDCEGKITLVNRKGIQILGYQPTELFGKNWFDTCLPSENRKQAKMHFRDYMKGEGGLGDHFEQTIITKSGEERVIEWHSTPLWTWKGDEKQLIGALSSGDDITRRKLRERAMALMSDAQREIAHQDKAEEIYHLVGEKIQELIGDGYVVVAVNDEKGEVVNLIGHYGFGDFYENMVRLLKFDPFKSSYYLKDMSENHINLYTSGQLKKYEDGLFNLLSRKVPRQICSLVEKESGITGMYVIGFNWNDRNFGGVTIFPKSEIAPFCHMIETIVNQASISIKRINSEKNLQKSEQNLRKSLDGTINTLAATIEVRDPYTAGHQARVAELAAAIAIELGISENQVDGIRMAGLIHDLGKIQIPAEILSKPGKLTELEFNLIKTHPRVGYDLLKDIEFPWPLPIIILQHHEKMDGSGYPQGLIGDKILLEARILTVADIVEAMSSYRPYRPGLGIESALEQISLERGTLLDPNVVDACLKIFNKGYKLYEK